MMKLVQKSRRSSYSGVIVLIGPGCAHPKNVLLGYDIGKISAGCLVASAFHFAAVYVVFHVHNSFMLLSISSVSFYVRIGICILQIIS